MITFDYDVWEKSLQKAATQVLHPFLSCHPQVCDECDFYPGQRFYIECLSPCRTLLFFELDFNLKEHLIRAVFDQDWAKVSSYVRDDCFMEFLTMIQEHHILNLRGSKNIDYRCSFPRVIYDEYEDDLEVSSLDLYRFDFSTPHGNFSLIRGVLPT